MKLYVSDAAKDDLDRIGSWIAEDNPARALSFVRELRAACTLTIDMPLVYRLLPGREGSGVRRKIHGNYSIFFRIDGDMVAILRVLYGSRDFEAILFPDD